MAAREPASETAAASLQGLTVAGGVAATRGNASPSCLRKKVGRVKDFWDLYYMLSTPGLNAMANMSLQVDNHAQQDADADTFIKTPECLPPPVSASTTGRRKKKLFTQSLGPQEFE